MSITTQIVNLPVSFAGDQVKPDIKYGSKNWQKLDLYYPDESFNKPLPLIVFFYGGRWSYGEKAQYKFFAKTFTDLGYAVAIPDYIKYPSARFPAFVEDAALAIAWLHNNAKDIGIDKDKLFVSGHSAGAHIGALVATDARYMQQAGGDRLWIKAFAGLAGPYSFTPEEPDLIDMFGPAEKYAQMQVPTFIDGEQPPMLLLHGGKDDTVGIFNIEKVEAAAHQKGGVVEKKIYPDIGHISIIATFTWIYRDKAGIAQDIDSFFKR